MVAIVNEGLAVARLEDCVCHPSLRDPCGNDVPDHRFGKFSDDEPGRLADLPTQSQRVWLAGSVLMEGIFR